MPLPKIGACGDSATDSYQDPSINMGGVSHAWAFTWLELLVRLGRVDCGAWGSYASPRGTDYANNFAFSGDSTGLAISHGQHTGLRDQISAGACQYAIVEIGEDDFDISPGANGEANVVTGIYNGTYSAGQISTWQNTLLTNLNTIIDTLLAASPPPLGVLVFTVMDFFLNDLLVQGLYPNAPGRARCSAAVVGVNALLRTNMAARGATVAVLDFDAAFTHPHYLKEVGAGGVSWVDPSGNGGSYEYWGQTVTLTTLDTKTSVRYLTHGRHASTIVNGEWANAVISGLNTSFGLGIKPLTPWEVIGEAGLGFKTGRIVRS